MSILQEDITIINLYAPKSEDKMVVRINIKSSSWEATVNWIWGLVPATGTGFVGPHVCMELFCL